MGCLGGEMDKDQDQRKEDLRRIGENWHLSDADLEGSWRPGRVLIEGAGLRIGLGPR